MKKRSRMATLALMVCLALALPLAAIAEDEAPTDADRSAALYKAFDYAVCAASIAVTPTGWGLALTVFTCGKALNLWFTD
ncbi:MAG: hypothetical protein E6K80_05395 [Candidatus Eisenbacteria bacterium]|uniref:Uncharacterized protein n=1 Tax=Eiseniibacteriota bacterium TaxID=2212470 RepID=A0A538U6K9_UNCEI|nr:MAG: hypothetical protein E6K80_05395 [Candidatus Eisenbacteria bacterium]